MRRRQLAMWTVAVMWPAVLLAQTPSAAGPPPMRMTLDELVAKALSDAPDLQATRLAIDRARGDAQQAALRANPMVTTERRDEIGGSDNMTSIGVAWPLELFRRGARVSLAAAGVAVATDDVAEAERQLAGEVRRRAGALAIAERRLSVTDEIAGSLRATYESLAHRADEGAAAPLLRDQAFVEWQRFEAQRPARRADLRAASVSLCALVGLPVDTTVAIADDLPAWIGRPLPAPALDARPDVRAAAARIDAAAASISLAQREGRFDLGVSGAYSRMNEGFPQLGLTADGARIPIQGVFHNVSLGLSVTVPISNRNQGAVAGAQADRRAAERRRDAAMLQASAEIAAARAHDEEARAIVSIYASGLRATAKKNLDVVRESFTLGRLTSSDVFAEQRRYLDVEMGYIDALDAAVAARANLMQALGVTR